MSRSALWRQEGAKKQREQQAEELFEMAVEEGRVSSNSWLVIVVVLFWFHFFPFLSPTIID
jgi:hypothetical protein